MRKTHVTLHLSCQHVLSRQTSSSGCVAQNIFQYADKLQRIMSQLVNITFTSHVKTDYAVIPTSFNRPAFLRMPERYFTVKNPALDTDIEYTKGSDDADGLTDKNIVYLWIDGVPFKELAKTGAKVRVIRRCGLVGLVVFVEISLMIIYG